MSDSPSSAFASSSTASDSDSSEASQAAQCSSSSILPPIEDPDYFFEDGMRHVKPYHFSFENFAKRHWWGRTILEVFTKDFPFQSKEHYLHKINTGKITVNKKKVSPEYVVRDLDMIVHTTHRHELPVRHCKIDIVYESPEIVVVDKPPSMPVHACGRYGKNTMTYILEKERGWKGLGCIHRLDRLTSGIVVMARNPKFGKKFSQEIEKGNVIKTYFARVRGKFPDTEVFVDRKIKNVDIRVGKFGCDAVEGKESQTRFKLLHYHEASGTSVVHCFPQTGRTHQIRLHLQYAGFPICNDPWYGHDLPLDQQLNALPLPLPPSSSSSSSSEPSGSDEESGDADRKRKSEDFLPASSEVRSKEEKREEEEERPSKLTKGESGPIAATSASSSSSSSSSGPEIQYTVRRDRPDEFDESCWECVRGNPPYPPADSMLIYLHAYSYEFTELGHKFQTEIPFWAEESYHPLSVYPDERAMDIAAVFGE